MLGGLSLLGPLSIDAYLPAFADIQRDFQASTADLQLTLTGYLLAFACMSLLHGALSDAFGRRRVILFALLAFALAALGCALAPSVGWLTAFRVVQGMSAGVGTVVGRAIIRDCFEGAAAARLLALVSMIFSLSPALAPVFGGWVVTLFTWRVIFLTLFAYAVAMLVLCGLSLPETLPRHARRPFGIGSMARQYVVVFRNRRFRLVALAIALRRQPIRPSPMSGRRDGDAMFRPRVPRASRRSICIAVGSPCRSCRVPATTDAPLRSWHHRMQT
jgi:DHA1 family bicyclomycin/chloramphenicol resistance-like MFS transporter